jgi:hypothetical protein
MHTSVDRMEQDPFEVLKNGDTVRVDGTSGLVEIPEGSEL